MNKAQEKEFHRAALTGEMGGDLQIQHAATDQIKSMRTTLRKIIRRCNAPLGSGRSKAVNEIADLARDALRTR